MNEIQSNMLKLEIDRLGRNIDKKNRKLLNEKIPKPDKDRLASRIEELEVILAQRKAQLAEHTVYIPEHE